MNKLIQSLFKNCSHSNDTISQNELLKEIIHKSFFDDPNPIHLMKQNLENPLENYQKTPITIQDFLKIKSSKIFLFFQSSFIFISKKTTIIMKKGE